MPRSSAGRERSRFGPPPNIVQQRRSTSGRGGGGGGGGGSAGTVGATTVTSVTSVSSVPDGSVRVASTATPAPTQSVSTAARRRGSLRRMREGRPGGSGDQCACATGRLRRVLTIAVQSG